MPRIAGSTQPEPRVTRSAAAMPDDGAEAAMSNRSRRAFRDVSNKGCSSHAEASKNTSDDPPLRRSRRLSRDNAANETTTTATGDETMTTTTTTNADANVTARGRSQSSNRAKREEKSKTRETAAKRSRSRSRTKSKDEDLIEQGPTAKRQKRRSSSRGKRCSISKLKTQNPCPDILEDGNHGLQRDSFDDSKFTAGVSSYDEVHKTEINRVTNYVTDIYQRLYDAEAKTRPHPYMQEQPELNGMMRSILVDWIVEVHLKFRLVPETLYLAINIIDRYLEIEQVQRKRLQLVGVTALLIACKYEEIYPPEVKDCVYITDRAYDRDDVLEMESHIVKVLKFRMTVPTGYPFLRRFLHVCKATRTAKLLANFYMERMLQEYSTLKHPPSLVAATAVALSMNNPDALESEGYALSDAPGVPEPLLNYTGFEVSDIKEVASLMEKKVGEIETTYSRRSLNAVKKKYAADKYDTVSSFVLPKCDHLE